MYILSLFENAALFWNVSVKSESNHRFGLIPVLACAMQQRLQTQPLSSRVMPGGIASRLRALDGISIPNRWQIDYTLFGVPRQGRCRLTECRGQLRQRAMNVRLPVGYDTWYVFNDDNGSHRQIVISMYGWMYTMIHPVSNVIAWQCDLNRFGRIDRRGCARWTTFWICSHASCLSFVVFVFLFLSLLYLSYSLPVLQLPLHYGVRRQRQGRRLAPVRASLSAAMPDVYLRISPLPIHHHRQANSHRRHNHHHKPSSFKRKLLPTAHRISDNVANGFWYIEKCTLVLCFLWTLSFMLIKREIGGERRTDIFFRWKGSFIFLFLSF